MCPVLEHNFQELKQLDLYKEGSVFQAVGGIFHICSLLFGTILILETNNPHSGPDFQGIEKAPRLSCMRGGCRKWGSGSHTDQTNQKMVPNGGSSYQQHRVDPSFALLPVLDVPVPISEWRHMGPHVWLYVVVREAIRRSGVGHEAPRTNT